MRRRRTFDSTPSSTPAESHGRDPRGGGKRRRVGWERVWTLEECKSKLFNCILEGDLPGFQRACIQAIRSSHASSTEVTPSSSRILTIRREQTLPPSISNLTGPENLRLMSYACKLGRLYIAKHMYKLGVSTRIPDQPPPHSSSSTAVEPLQRSYPYAGWTPLHHACAEERFMLVSWLVTEAGAYGDCDREASDGLVTPRSLGLDRLLKTAKRVKDSEKILKIRQIERKREKERKRAEEVVQNARRKKQAQNWSHRLQIEVEREAKSMGDGLERWFESVWGNLSAERERHYAMSREEWGELLEARRVLARAKKAIVLSKHGTSKNTAHGSSRTSKRVGEQREWKGMQEKFLEIEDKWERFEQRFGGNQANLRKIKPDCIPFPTPPPDIHRPPPAHSFGYFGDLAKTIRETDKGGSSKGTGKRILRTLYLRYHPDKILPRFSGRCDEADLQLILDKAKAVTQALTSVKTHLNL